MDIKNQSKKDIIFGKNPNKSSYSLYSEVISPKKISEIFSFFSDAENLGKITPHSLDFKIISPLPITMKKGALIDYRIKLHGIPIPWRTEITAWEPPYSFVDEQIKGPYLLWRHAHYFKEDDNGNTRIIDHVDYKVPGGYLVNKLFVAPQLKEIFTYRREYMMEHFG